MIEIKYCSKCRLGLVNSFKFCTNCGHTTADALKFFCVNEHPMMMSEKFCGECGGLPVHNLDDQEDVETPGNANQAEND